MFPQTSNGQKPVDMFLANLKTVDMFLEPDRDFANRRGYELVNSFPRATRYKETYRSPYAGIQNDEPL